MLVESSKLSYENAKEESKAENSSDEGPKLKELKTEQEVKEEVDKFALDKSQDSKVAMDDNQEVNSKEAVKENIEKTEDTVTEEKNDNQNTMLVESSKLSYENAKEESKAENSSDEGPKLKELKTEQEVKEEVDKFALDKSQDSKVAIDDNQEVNSKEAVKENIEKSVIVENYDSKVKELKTEGTNKNDTIRSEEDLTEIVENVQAEEKNQAGNEEDSVEGRFEAAEFGNVKKPPPFPPPDNEIPSSQDKEDVSANVEEDDQNKGADISTQACLFLGLTATSGLVGFSLGWLMTTKKNKDNMMLAGLCGTLGLVYISYRLWTKKE